MIRFAADCRSARAATDEPLTTGSVGVPVEVALSAEFDGLAATLVFEAGDASADVPLMGQAVTVPSDVLAEPGERLYMGVWASDAGGTVVIPTVWAHVGTVTEGTRPSGVEPVGPAPSWAAQVQQAAADAVETANGVRADADAGVFDGEDGYSPSAKVLQGDGSATISITDKDGTTTATVHDGTDGRDGRDGTDGVDGFSPTATVTQAASGATITITDKSGTTTASVSNGTDGTDGTDGFSPTVDVQAITGGHEVTITDADGAHSFDVMDGDPAAPGSVTDAMLAPDGIKPQVGQLWGNQLTGTLSGTIATADDAYAAPPMSLTVDGRSTQAGTPTPDAPVPILSVDAPVLWLAGKNLLDVSEWTPNRFINEMGVEVSSGDAHCTTNYSPIAAGSYVFTMQRRADGGNVVRLHGYDKNKNWVQQVYMVRLNAGTTDYSQVITIGDGIKYLRMSSTVGASQYQLELGSTATAYQPYDGASVPLYDGTLRSLPDGTKDTLSLSYLRPSTREGWAWYSREVTQRVGTAGMGTLDWSVQSAASGIYYALLPEASNTGACLCSCYQWQASTGSSGLQDGHACRQSAYNRVLVKDTAHANMTKADYTALVDGETFDYSLATPVTTTLDPIELPTLPAPNCTVWCDPATGLQMGYVRDTGIVIARLESAIADLATS